MSSKRDYLFGILIIGIWALVLFTSIVVILGWWFSVESAKAFVPNTPEMTMSTAIGFFIASFILVMIFIANTGPSYMVKQVCDLLLPLFSLASILLIIPFAVESQVGAIAFDIDALSMWKSPSLGTIVGFSCISMIGWLYTTQVSLTPVFMKVFSLLTMLIGIMALVGYSLNMPILYFSFSNSIDRGVAIHTAGLFILSGLALLLVSGIPQHKE